MVLHARGRSSCAPSSPASCKIDAAKIRVTPSEIGGGFGGKTTSYAETVAIHVSRKTNRPVKIVLTRNEVFRCTGPVRGACGRIKIGATHDGKITAAEAEMAIRAGAFYRLAVP